MSWRTTGILFLVLIVVAAVVVIMQQGDMGEASLTPTVSPLVEVTDLFGGVSIDDVVRVEILRTEPTDEAIFEQDEVGLWSQTVPTTTKVLSMTLTNQVSGLLNMRARRSFSPEAGDLAPYGLDTPQATIIVAAHRKGETVRYELAVGDQAPTGSAYYVQRKGDPRVHLLSTAALDGLLGLLDTIPLPETPSP